MLKCKVYMQTALIIGISTRCPHCELSEMEKGETRQLLKAIWL